MQTNLIPWRGWRPMAEASHDMNEVLLVFYHEGNKPSGRRMVQLVRWAPNMLGEEWAWRPAHRLDGGIAYADGWMPMDKFQAACQQLASAQQPALEFDL